MTGNGAHHRRMIGMLKPSASDAIPKMGGVKGPPADRFAGPIDWSCAHCGALLVRGVNEMYAEHALPCYACGEFNRTPYPGEKR